MSKFVKKIRHQTLKQKTKKNALIWRIRQKVTEIGGDTTFNIPPRSIVRKSVNFNRH